MTNLKQCPVCKQKFLKQGLKNHIINSAKGEAYRDLFRLLIYAKNKPYTFLSAVLRRNALHLNYMVKNYKLTNKRELKI